MTRILLTNDDGIHSNGLIKLEEALKEVGDVYVVAPASEMSGASHSLTLAGLCASGKLMKDIGRLTVRPLTASPWPSTRFFRPNRCHTFVLRELITAGIWAMMPLTPAQ